MTTDQGYVKLRVGVGHPLADANGYAYEHDLIMAAAGRRLAAGEVVHHRNGDRLDNRIENLEILARGDHNARHLAERARDGQGRLLPTSPIRGAL